MRQFLLTAPWMLYMLVSCGGGGEKNGVQINDTTVESQQVTPVRSEGEYRAVLTGVNQFDANGIASIKLIESKVELKFNLIANNKGPVQIQKIVAIKKCPELSDDSNADGIVDVGESVLRQGEVVANFSETMSEELNLHQRTLENTYLMVLGVNSRIKLPATVETLEGHSAQESVPLACGKIMFVANET